MSCHPLDGCRETWRRGGREPGVLTPGWWERTWSSCVGQHPGPSRWVTCPVTPAPAVPFQTCTQDNWKHTPPRNLPGTVGQVQWPLCPPAHPGGRTCAPLRMRCFGDGKEGSSAGLCGPGEPRSWGALGKRPGGHMRDESPARTRPRWATPYIQETGSGQGLGWGMRVRFALG